MNTTTSDREAAVQKLIRGTIRRAWTESLACVAVLIAFGSVLQFTETGSPRYYGCLLILVSAGFIAGVVWSFTLGYKLTETHPVSDHAFWYTAFQTQAKLLRLVPLWYCAPLCSGVLLFSAQAVPGLLGIFVFIAMGVITIGVSAGVVWLNRKAAFDLDRDSQLFIPPQPA